MQFIHVKNLETFHPGYKDRQLVWAKIYFDMVQGDPEFELIENEVDKWRFVGLICLELRAQKPLPNDDKYWKKYFDIKKRPMSMTLNMLQKFLESVTEDENSCSVDKEEDKEKSRVEERYVTVAENVKLRDDEYEKLLVHFGGSSEALKRAIDILDNYKGSSGKRYKSDYRTILGWVTDKIKKEGGGAINSAGGAKHSGSKAGGATTGDDLTASLAGLEAIRSRGGEASSGGSPDRDRGG